MTLHLNVAALQISLLMLMFCAKRRQRSETDKRASRRGRQACADGPRFYESCQDRGKRDTVTAPHSRVQFVSFRKHSRLSVTKVVTCKAEYRSLILVFCTVPFKAI